MQLTPEQVKERLDKRGFLALEIPENLDLSTEIKRLKKKKNAVLLAHYYQDGVIQELADYLGDSLYLAQVAEKVSNETIIFAGVHFMAETAKIINPNKKVLLPDLKAGCSLADSCPPIDFKKFIDQYPGAHVVTYINCSAEIKALSTIVCTSSNARRVIESIPEEETIIFAPDKNLGNYLIKETGRDMILWDGSCIVHEAFSFERIVTLSKSYPNAKFIAHPESESQVLEIADYIGSTSGLLNYVQESSATEFIVATEAGILYEMEKRCPKKMFIPAPIQDETCACSECAFMKLNTLEKLYLCLEHEKPEIKLSNKLIEKARLPIIKMLELG
ncbi:MAG: quinolinate synthase [Flavobacteriaceae bacterium]|nr:quinolinate synthase [Flavobacteriaceae bacterium]MEC8547654.1 quinolinate synthase NadA [Bacteroidota bacterium]MEE2723302.1 quinolinate synthase NadA [Bacteroidota bacterium]|tara:strand:+ start:189 stop:1184 length:996 start_codon:yes stop_codon:yes gene_type:complete